ncbi:hypothetical protein [Baekduia soli]|nr:hypothetical protein [Baekduia soli]
MRVEHVSFSRATVADQAAIESYLRRAYRLGGAFEPAGLTAGAA